MATERPQKIHFSLEQAEREHAVDVESREPFRADVQGRTITFTDPSELDWKTILDIDHPVMFLRHCVPDEEDRKFLREAKIPGYAFNKLMEGFQRHYGLGDKGNGVASRI